MIWFLSIGLCLGVCAYLSIPLYLNRAASEKTHEAAQNEVLAYRKEIRRIKKMIADEGSDVSALTAERTVLERKLIKAGSQISDTPLNRKAIWVASIFIVLTTGTFGIYGVIGSPDLTRAQAKKLVLRPSQSASQNLQPENAASVDDVIAGLEIKLQAGSKNPQDWGLYARALMATNRFDEAFVAYENTLSLTNYNPQVVAEFESARAYAAQQRGGSVQQGLPSPQSTGPSREDIEAAAQLNSEDRNAMIQGMVDGLSLKLADNPDNQTGWVRLLRARQVLGQLEIAEDEIRMMKTHFKDEPDTVSAILKQSGWKN